MKKGLRFLLMMCLLAVLGLNTQLRAQSPQTIEIGPHFGATSYVGDLNVWRNLSQWDWKQLNQFHYNLGGVVRFNYDTRWSFRLDYSYLHVRAQDTTTAWRPESLLNFKTTAHDLSLLVEFNFLDYYTGKNDKGFSPYIFGGISGLLYWVQPFTGDEALDAYYFNDLHGELETVGNRHYLADVFTSDTTRKSVNKTLSIPFGIGCKVSISEHLALTAEWRMHYTFTDYFDGVSGNYPDIDKHVLLVASQKMENGTPVFDPQGNPVLENYKIGHRKDLLDDTDLVFVYNFTDPTTTEFSNDANNVGNFPGGYQRGNARNNDWFGMFNLSLTWKFIIPDNAACQLTDH